MKPRINTGHIEVRGGAKCDPVKRKPSNDGACGSATSVTIPYVAGSSNPSYTPKSTYRSPSTPPHSRGCAGFVSSTISFVVVGIVCSFVVALTFIYITDDEQKRLTQQTSQPGLLQQVSQPNDLKAAAAQLPVGDQVVEDQLTHSNEPNDSDNNTDELNGIGRVVENEITTQIDSPLRDGTTLVSHVNITRVDRNYDSI